MAMFTLIVSKTILAVLNILLLICGCTLVTGGIIVIFDSERILLSKLLASDPVFSLPQPLFYYLSLGVAVMGMMITGVGVVGCWASCSHSYCLLTTYFVIIFAFLVGECAVYLVAWIWPQCLGLTVESDFLVKALQQNYGTVGQEQFTAAFDLAQATFNCCAVASANEFDTSLWRLQSLGPSLTVPLSCCKLKNAAEPKSYLNPQPLNTSLCQAPDANRHVGWRHPSGCIDHLDSWYRVHHAMFLLSGLAIVLVESFILLSVILTCIKIYKKNHEEKIRSGGGSSWKRSDRSINKPSHKKFSMPEFSNDTYNLVESYKQPISNY